MIHIGMNMSNKEDENVNSNELDDDIIEFEDAPDEIGADASVNDESDTSGGDIEFDMESEDELLNQTSDGNSEKSIDDYSIPSNDDSETEEEVVNDTQLQKKNSLIKYAIFGGGALMIGLASVIGYGILVPQNNDANGLIPTGSVASATGIKGLPQTQTAVPGIKGLNTPLPAVASNKAVGFSPSGRPDVNSVLNSLSSSNQGAQAPQVHQGNPVSNKRQTPMDATSKPFQVTQTATQESTLDNFGTNKATESVKSQDFKEIKDLTLGMRGVIDREFRAINQKLDKGIQSDKEISTLKGEIKRLGDSISNLEAEKALLDAKGKTQQETIAKLESLAQQAYEKILEYKKENASLHRKLRPVVKQKAQAKKEDKTQTPASLGEWSVIGANESMVIIKSTSGESVMKSIGDSINGHKILKIDIKGNLIHTSDGYIEIP